MIKFNINHDVRVKLTHVGREVLRKAHVKLNHDNNGLFGRYTPPAEDSEGWSKWQLWDLMKQFGPHCFNGCRVPFETEIEILNKDQ